MKTVAADARHLPFRDDVAQVAVTSPPYFGRRVYGDSEDELGVEDLTEYVINTVLWMREVRRVLKPEGVAWVVIGDTAAGSGGAGGDHNKGGGKERIRKYKQGAPTIPLPYVCEPSPYWYPNARQRDNGRYVDHVPTRLPHMNWCQVPAHVAMALQADGWWLRHTIVWDKGRDRPESLDHVKRPRESHETVLMLAPTKNAYKWYPERLAETGSVWHIPPGNRAAKGHPAPFPHELVARCILPVTDLDDVVLDPFHGSGSTGAVAEQLGRRILASDLYTEWVTS